MSNCQHGIDNGQRCDKCYIAQLEQELSDQIDATLEMADAVIEREGMVPDMHTTRRAMRLFESEYIGQDALKLWQWAWGQAIEQEGE